MRRIFLDHASGCPMDARVIKHMEELYDKSFGNPSSLHTLGLDARKKLEDSREKVAKLIGAERKEEIIFTSGATESNNLALIGYALRNKNGRRKVVVSKIEHISIMNVAKYLSKLGFEVAYAPVDEYGRVKLPKLDEIVDSNTLIVSIAYANGEIGTTQDIRAISDIVHAKGAILHSDGVPAVGRIPVNVVRDQVDMLTLSSNDLYGPKGVGALYVKTGTRIQPIIFGGGQEKGLRSGTENVPAIAGFGMAAEIMYKEWREESEREKQIRDKLIDTLTSNIEQAYLNGHRTLRLPNNASLRFIGIEGESLVLNLDAYGIMASTGSACSSKTLEPSHVLMAIVPNEVEAHGSLMLTLGRDNRIEEVDQVSTVIKDVVSKLRAMSPLWGKPLDLEEWRQKMEHSEGE
ncbi:MAG: cysteine desulfurase family protein [Nitrososphaeria archaeon]